MSAPLTAEPYDRIAEGYRRWWAPVLEPTALRVLDLIAETGPPGAAHLLDVGTGTGTLALAATRRWRQARVTGIDASSGMVTIAGRAADEELSVDDRSRVGFEVAYADKLPFADGSFDAAVSSFVLQLVPNRARALREIRRILRPGGTVAWVTWQAGRSGQFAPDDAFDDALDALGIGARDEPDNRSGDIPSPSTAIGQLRSSGFAGARAWSETLEYRFDAESYFAFMTEFDEQDLVESMEPAEQERFLADFRRRLGRLRPVDFVFEAPVVFAVATSSLRPR